MPPPAPTGAAERAWLTEHVIKPLAKFSLAQEAAISKEQDRADTLAGLIASANAILKGTNP